MTEDTVGTEQPSKRTPGKYNGASAQADARAIFDHVLACVLPEPALRRYVQLDESTQHADGGGQNV